MELPVVNLERKSQLNPSARKLLWLWVCQQALCGAAETGTSQLFVQSEKMRHVTCIGILALLVADELICLLSAKALNMSNWNMELPVVNLERKSQLKPSAPKLLWLWVGQQALCGAAETGTSQHFVQSGKMRHVTCIGILALLVADEQICLLSANSRHQSENLLRSFFQACIRGHVMFLFTSSQELRVMFALRRQGGAISQ